MIRQTMEVLHRFFHIIVILVLSLHIIVLLGWPVFESKPIGENMAAIFETTCHQNPDRSHSINGHLMPLCSRCFGLFIGLWVASLFLFFRSSYGRYMGGIGIFLLAAMFVDWGLGLTRVVPDGWLWWRTFTGGLGGIGLYLFLNTLPHWTVRALERSTIYPVDISYSGYLGPNRYNATIRNLLYPQPEKTETL